MLHNLTLNKPLRITTKPPLAVETHSPVSKASNQIVGSKTDVQFNTLPRYNKPKPYPTKPFDRFPPLGRINIRTLRPKSQSPTRSNSHHGDDRLHDIPTISPSPSTIKPPFFRGHRRGSSWIQVSMFTSVIKSFNYFTISKSLIVSHLIMMSSHQVRLPVSHGDM